MGLDGLGLWSSRNPLIEAETLAEYEDQLRQGARQAERVHVIFLDVDGVLADFVGGTLACMKSQAQAGQPTPCWPPTEWPPQSWNAAIDNFGLTVDEFWKRIENREGFWDDLAVCPLAESLLAMCREYCPNVRFLTAPCHDPESAAAKIRWLRRFADAPQLMDWHLSVDKQFNAGPGRILIDDNEKNCAAWEAAGGHAIIYPQPWNFRRAITYPQAKLAYVEEQLQKLTGVVPEPAVA